MSYNESLKCLRKTLSKHAWWSYFNSLRSWNNEPVHPKSRIYPTNQAAFLKEISKELADFPLRLAAAELIVKLGLGKIEKHLGRVVAAIERSPRYSSPLEREYRYFEIPKKTGGSRQIQSPSEWLANLQRRIYRQIESRCTPHEACHGFTTERSIVTNAAPHCGSKTIFRFDIKNAFASTSQKMLIKTLKRDLNHLEISSHSYFLLSQIFTHNNALPTGAPSSPFLLNRCLHEVDEGISKFCSNNGLQYTRYADDITISGHDIESPLKKIEHHIRHAGYQINHTKSRQYSNGVRQIVTGIVCNQKPNIPRTTQKKLRAALHQWHRNGNATWNGLPVTKSILDGHIHFLNMVNPAAAGKLKQNHKNECASPDAN